MQYPDYLQQNLSDSASDFKNIVWPHIANHPDIGGGELRSVEAVSKNNFADELDVLAGIDAWQIVANRRGMRGIASRIQWGTDYQSFTVRHTKSNGAETEYAKRIYAINNPSEGLVYPHLTVQAFLDSRGGQLLSVAAIPTLALFQQIEKLFEWDRLKDGSDSRYGIRTADDETQFIYISWQYIAHSGIAQQLICF